MYSLIAQLNNATITFIICVNSMKPSYFAFLGSSPLRDCTSPELRLTGLQRSTLTTCFARGSCFFGDVCGVGLKHASNTLRFVSLRFWHTLFTVGGLLGDASASSGVNASQAVDASEPGKRRRAEMT